MPLWLYSAVLRAGMWRPAYRPHAAPSMLPVENCAFSEAPSPGCRHRLCSIADRFLLWMSRMLGWWRIVFPSPTTASRVRWLICFRLVLHGSFTARRVIFPAHFLLFICSRIRLSTLCLCNLSVLIASPEDDLVKP